MNREGKIVLETTVLERAPSLCSNKGSRCPECPDFNTNPPDDSECLYFEVRGGIPICTRADGMQKQLERWLDSGVGGVGNLARQSLRNRLNPGQLS